MTNSKYLFPATDGASRPRFRENSDAFETVIDVALGFDEVYAPHAAAVIASVVARTPNTSFRFILLHPGVQHATRELVESVSPRSIFFWAAVGDDDLPAFANKNWITRATLFRLGLEKLAPEDCEKVIYLDSDLIVLDSIRTLWNIDLGDCALGACADAYIDPAAFASRWNLPPNQDYFNAGVLLIDLKKIRAGKLFSKAIDFVARHDRDLPFSDQDALNWVFGGAWKVLDRSWNVQRHMIIDSLIDSIPAHKRLDGRTVRIVHFTGADKPWIAGTYHPLAAHYWRRLTHTPFARHIKRDVSLQERIRIRMRLFRWRIKLLLRGNLSAENVRNTLARK